VKSVFKSNKPMLYSVISLTLGTAALLFTNSAFAAETLADVAESVLLTLEPLARMITAVAYIAGLGFGIGAILKFKAHKDNPTQIPVGTPIALLFIAAALIFLPTIFTIAGTTLFGEGKRAGTAVGTSTID